MAGARIYLVIAVLLVLHSCSSESNQKTAAPEFKQISEVRDVSFQKPVKIKLKRSDKGNYSWELNGDDAERVIETDAKLRDSLKVSAMESK